jgi:hypothetical protein
MVKSLGYYTKMKTVIKHRRNGQMSIAKDLIFEEWKKEDERAREHKIKMLKEGEVTEEVFKLTNNLCQGGCGDYLDEVADGWGICLDCRLEKDD